jgi:hypothetical protein
MVKQTAERVELYARVPSVGAALPFNFLYFKISDDMLTDSEDQKQGLQQTPTLLQINVEFDQRFLSRSLA